MRVLLCARPPPLIKRRRQRRAGLSRVQLLSLTESPLLNLNFVFPIESTVTREPPRPPAFVLNPPPPRVITNAEKNPRRAAGNFVVMPVLRVYFTYTHFVIKNFHSYQRNLNRRLCLSCITVRIAERPPIRQGDLLNPFFMLAGRGNERSLRSLIFLRAEASVPLL